MAKKARGKERRRQRRVTAPTGFVVEVREPTRKEVATLADISEGGIGVAMKHSIEPGTHVAVDVRSPTGTRVTCIATVKHVKDGETPGSYHVGLELEGLNMVQKLAVGALLKVAKSSDERVALLKWLD